jgi:hypothetical protein
MRRSLLDACVEYAVTRFGAAVTVDESGRGPDGDGSVVFTNSELSASIEVFGSEETASLFAGWLIVEPKQVGTGPILSAMDLVMTYGIVALRYPLWTTVISGPAALLEESRRCVRIRRRWVPWTGAVAAVAGHAEKFGIDQLNPPATLQTSYVREPRRYEAGRS